MERENGASLLGLWVQTAAWCGQRGSRGREGRQQHVTGAEARGGGDGRGTAAGGGG